MGTRSLTYVYNENQATKTQRVLCMYRQCDGYPSGHGKELYSFLSSGKMVNGISPDDATVFNGSGCLAAQMVAYFKDGPGNIYLLPTHTSYSYQDYSYHVYFQNEQFCIEVRNHKNKKLFSGSLEEFGTWCDQED